MLATLVGADLFIVVAIVAFFVVPLWAIIDAAIRPGPAWRGIGRSKTVWLVLLVVSFLLLAPVSLIIAIIYFASIRGRLRDQASQAQNSGWTPSSSGPISAPPPPGWYPNPQDPRFVVYWDGTRYTEQRLASPP